MINLLRTREEIDMNGLEDVTHQKQRCAVESHDLLYVSPSTNARTVSVVQKSTDVNSNLSNESENRLCAQTVENISQTAFAETSGLTGSNNESTSISFFLESDDADQFNQNDDQNHILQIEGIPEIDEESNNSQQNHASLPTTSDFAAIQYSLHTLVKLERTKLCNYVNCDDMSCQEVRSRLKELEDPNVSVEDLNAEQKDLLTFVCEHCYKCDELRCPFYWCWSPAQGMGADIEDFEMKLAKKHLEGFANDSIQWKFSDPKFTKLDDSVMSDIMPVVYQDWVPLCRFPGSSAVLATPTMDQTTPTMDQATPTMNQVTPTMDQAIPEQGMWVLTMIPSGEEETLNWQLRLFYKLRQLRHDNIARLLWMATVQVCENSESCRILLCSQFEGSSLHERMQSQPLDVQAATSITLQLLSATEYLHSLGIVYLNWSSSNVLLSERDKGLVKLIDFSASVLLEENVDDEYHRMVLPKHLFPPELLSSSQVCEQSDIWGLACLLVELLTGQTVWHDLRHDDEEHLQEEMEKLKVPSIPDSLPKTISCVIAGCWKIVPTERHQISDFRKILFQCHDRSRCVE